MSRVGRQTITIPQGTQVSYDEPEVVVSGPKGELRRRIRPVVDVHIDDNTVTLSPKGDDRRTNALWGTFSSHIANMVQGVNEPFQKQLVVEGVGFRAEVSGNTLVLGLGYSHSIEVPFPESLEVSVEKGVITVRGIDKEEVGQFAARVRATKKPEPYKGKGIRYADEEIRRKEGKSA